MMRQISRYGLALVMVVVVAGPAHAQRKGFIIGGGLGPGFTAGDVDSKVGLTTEFKIGGMIGESIQLYYANRVNWTDSEFWDVQGMGVGGIGITYQMPNKVRLNGLIGNASAIAYSADDSDSQFGFGVGAGVGYEFAKHWIIGVDGSYGRIEGANVVNAALTVNILSH